MIYYLNLYLGQVKILDVSYLSSSVIDSNYYYYYYYYYSINNYIFTYPDNL